MLTISGGQIRNHHFVRCAQEIDFRYCYIPRGQWINVWSLNSPPMACHLKGYYWGLVYLVSFGNHFKIAYKLLNLKSLNIWPVRQSLEKWITYFVWNFPLEFHMKYLTHTLKDRIWYSIKILIPCGFIRHFIIGADNGLLPVQHQGINSLRPSDAYMSQ